MKRLKWSGEQFERHCKKAAELAFHGLTTDGDHHKQWYLEQIVRELGFNPEEFVVATELHWEPGIAP
jgi:hypothetical protein